MVSGSAPIAGTDVRESTIDRLVALAFWTLSVLCLLNLNGLIRMWTGGERAASDAMLFCCLVALMGLVRIGPRSALGTPGALLGSCLLSYAGIGVVVTTLNGTYPQPQSEWWYVERYAKSMLIIVAVAVSGGVLLSRRGGAERVMRGLLLVMTASCALILASPWLRNVLRFVPRNAEYRFFGSFADPNEAGLMACFTIVLALVLVASGRSRVFAVGALPVALVALVGTFSRTALVALPIVMLCTLLASRSARRKRVAAIAMLTSVIVAATVAIFNVDRFDERQISRWISLVEFVEPLSGSDLALVDRQELWSLGLEQTLDAPLLGNGLGRLHRLDGAWYNLDGDLLGVHNQYLILVGEAGFLPLALFVLFFAVTFQAGFRKEGKDSWFLGAICGWSIILAVFSVTFHGVLTYRFCNFIMGLICAIIASGSRDEGLRPETT